MPSLEDLPVGGILPRASCYYSLIWASWRSAMVTSAHVTCFPDDTSSHRPEPACHIACCSFHRRNQQALHHTAGRLQLALQHVGSWEAGLHPQEGQAQRRHVRRIARLVWLTNLLACFGHGEGGGCEPGSSRSCHQVRMNFHQGSLDPAAAINSCIICKLLDASMVLQATPPHDGEERYWFVSTFFCSAPDVVCYSICGVPVDAPGMDMMLDSLISNNWYAHNSVEIFDLGHESVVVAELCMHWDNLECVNRCNQVDQLVTSLMNIFVHTQQRRIYGSTIDVFINLEFIFKYIMAGNIVTQERHFLRCSSCTCLSLSHGPHVEDAVSMLFGLCHRRWTTTPPSLIPRFNSGDTLSLSSVNAIIYLQLNSTPRVHIPDRLSGEPPTGHQLDRTCIEALEDCKCGNFEFGLSTDDRTPYGSICDRRHLLHEFRPSSCCVQLDTYIASSTVESHVMIFHDP